MHAVHTVGSLGAQHGGPSRSITSLCSALSRLSVDVDLLSFGGRSGEPADLRPESETVHTHLVEGNQTSLLALWRPHNGFLSMLCRVAVGNQTILHDHGMWVLTNHASA